MTTAIKIEGLSKKYIIGHEKQGHYSTLRESLSHSARSFARRIRHPLQPNTEEWKLEEFWALKDINIEISQGDKVGIIGRNGAGKSTLLKILSRITEPTAGKIHINGRIASLLEVGTGFHPELTGRENIYLNGAILGMNRKEIKSKFDEIVDFADIEKFLDTPVKRYSSGMYVRLAFAIAAHLEPEILIVDEVLAVGDAQFQKKCIGKMEEAGSEGRTILFVSHNMSAINTLCNKGILLNTGKVVCDDTSSNVIIEYMQQDIVASGHKFVGVVPKDPNAKAVIYEAYVLDAESNPSHSVFIDQESAINIIWKLNVNVPFLRVGIEITDSMGVVIISSMDTDSTDLHGKPRKPGIFNETMKIPPYVLMPDNYSVKVFAGIPGIERIMEVDNLLSFEVLDNQSHLSNVVNERRSGYVAMALPWEVNFDSDQ